MEASNLTLHGDDADRFAQAFVESKVRESRRSINKRGVRNIHRCRGDGFTQIAYERAAAYEDSWLMVSLLVEESDDNRSTVTVLVGGGGEGPFKFEAVTVRRILQGEQSVGQAGRFVTVLEEINQVCESLDLTVETEWESDVEESTARAIQQKIFES